MLEGVLGRIGTALGLGLAVLGAPIGCGGSHKAEPAPDELRQPTGIAMSPDGRFLFVSNGNWDQEQTGGTVMVLDLEAVHEALARSAAPPGTTPSGSRPCRVAGVDDPTIECEPRFFVERGQTVVLGSAVGNIAIDRPSGGAGQLRLLVVQRIPSSVVWIDAQPTATGIELDCGQDETRQCDLVHTIDAVVDDPSTGFPSDPSRVVLDHLGFRFAYVPHLLNGSLSLHRPRWRARARAHRHRRQVLPQLALQGPRRRRRLLGGRAQL